MTPPDDPKAELEALAREGAIAGRAVREREARARRKERAMLARMDRATSRQALLENDWRFWVTIIVCVGLGISCFLATRYQTQLGLSSGAAQTIAIGGLIFFVGIAWCSRYFWGARLERDTTSWLRRLPFEVRGYLERLHESPTEHATVEVSLTFVDQAPERNLVEDLIGRVGRAGGRLEGDHDGTFKVVSGTIVCPSGETSSTNANVGTWMRSFITEVVTPLHRAYPVAKVKFHH